LGIAVAYLIIGKLKMAMEHLLIPGSGWLPTDLSPRSISRLWTLWKQKCDSQYDPRGTMAIDGTNILSNFGNGEFSN
jgi:hypothetical protein